MTEFSGTWAALITPFADNNTVDEGVLRDLLDYLIAQGISGFYVCGSTGEGLMMSLGERQQVAEITLKHVDGRLPSIIHVGATALVDAITLAQHARDLGAAAVSSIIPPKFTGMDSILRYYGALAAATPGFPIIAYLLNPEIDALNLVRELLQYPEIAGVKYTGANMNEFRQIVQLGDGRDWTVFSGMDEMSLYAAMMGSSGHIGSTINLMPKAYQTIRDHYLAGEYVQAQRYQERANHITNLVYQSGNFPAALKFTMRLRGLNCGASRLPVPPLTDRQRQWVLDHVTANMLADL